MSRTRKIIIGLAIAGAVGITYVTTALRGMPEVFDWDEDDND